MPASRLSRSLITGLMATFLGAQAPGVHGIDPANLDASVAPCQDFFQYANGAWIRKNPIPGDQPAWGAFNELAERNRTILKSVLEDAAQAKAPRGSILQKVGDFYASGMDTRAIEKAGVSPLRPVLARIDAMHGPRDLAEIVARAHMEGGSPAFGFGVNQDDKDSTAYIAQLAQGGLGLPDRDYYTSSDEKSRDLRGKYAAHVARLFELMGEKPALAKAHAGIVMDMETRLAKASMTRVEQRDPNALYHKMTREELLRTAPGFDWNTYFKAVGFKEKDLLVRQPRFFQELSAMVRELPPAQWKVYLRWHAVHATASHLSSAFEKETYAFYGTTLYGAKEMPERWKRVQGNADACLGEALGQLYVNKAFSPKAKERALELVENLRAALRERILKLEWMTEPTKQAALTKLNAFMVKIGYPDTWRDYSALPVIRASYAENIRQANVFEFRRNMAKLGKPIDRAEWGMTPATVNAYYNPQLNEIVFPAGILQPPFFDPQADDAVNYGAIGMVIGHEMTHGFDDEGRQYDAKGNLKDWWTPADVKAFDSRTGLVVDQYDHLETLPGLHLNGKLTLGENIADLGGLKIAFAAFRKSLEGKPRPAAIDGFTPEQRFFLGYAQAWRFHAREEYIRLAATVDPHSPARFRVNAPLANLPEFQEAIGCKEGNPMSRPADKRPAIW